jgi:hypothetical protein
MRYLGHYKQKARPYAKAAGHVTQHLGPDSIADAYGVLLGSTPWVHVESTLSVTAHPRLTLGSPGAGDVAAILTP